VPALMPALVESGIVSIDATRIAGNPAGTVNDTFELIARQIISKAVAADQAEDEEFAEARGHELTELLRGLEGRRD
jgi:hypothetical protein